MSYHESTPQERHDRLLDVADAVGRMADFAQALDDVDAELFYAHRANQIRSLAATPRDMDQAVRAVRRILGGR